jgi:hypothetical protein
MINYYRDFVTLMIGTILFIEYTAPLLYNLMNPIGFWQNFVMLFSVDLLAFCLVVGGISNILNRIWDGLF